MDKEQAPLIGLSPSHTDGGSRVSPTYLEAIRRAGGAPVIIPVITDGELLRRIVSQLDGLVLTGGADADPYWYGEEPLQQLQSIDPARDTLELKLIKMAADRNIPILGICRGEQLINIAFGGTLYQDIPAQRSPDYIKHVQQAPREHGSHTISILHDSQLAAIVQTTSARVNSFHHQAGKEIAPGFRAVAFTSDNVVEAIEAWPNRPILGVQWHPEAMAGDTTMQKLFCFLINKATVFRQAKEMHNRIISLDSHTDTPLWFNRPGFSFGARRKNQVNLPKMEEGKIDAVYLAAFIGQKERDEASFQLAVEKVTSLIEGIYQQAAAHPGLCGIATTEEDLLRLKKQGKKAIFVGIENGYGLGKDLTNIAKYKEMGVTYITLCHSYDNDICDTSTRTKNEWNGLSPFGREVVKEMNRLGIMVDLSHASEKTFWDVMELSTVPVICSHSSARALCEHDRNLTDEQLRALAQNGGVAQVCLLSRYINEDYKNASLTDAIEHIDHMVKVAGIDHVGIGSDFDGGGGLIGCNGHNDLIQITVKLIEKGYTEEEIEKIWGGNLLRVLNTVQAAAIIK
ncbi:MAG: gamma-glutamyl-gamma-aminobutyrate hydrolase family protein [Tannerellaceae bacterium]|nr:gamma-glutamyl-gamma-aminobutyrate hydrolase family protein [Tannerellaceae bacterium]